MIVVLVETAERHRPLGALQLTLHVVVFRTAVRFQSQATVRPQLPLGAKSMRRLHQRDQQSSPNRTDIGNPAEQLRRAMLAALRQKIAPCFLAQLLQPIQLLIEQLGPAPNAWFRDLAQPFRTMTRCIDRGATAGNTPASVQRFYPVHGAREILADRQVTAAQLLQRSESGLAMIDR